MRKSRGALIAFGAALLFLLSGCFPGAVDELYSLPKPAEQSLHLRELIETEISGGSEYAAPIDGAFRQSVQLVDIDGDKTDEALLFLRKKSGKPYINIYSEVNREYSFTASIDGEGSAIGSVDYADLDGDGILDLVVEWQSGVDLKMLRVYSLRDWVAAVKLTCHSSAFRIVDIDADGGSELLCVRLEGNDKTVTLYRFSQAEQPLSRTAELSAELLSLDRIRSTVLADGAPALFVEGKCGDTMLMTDIIVWRGDNIVNITTGKESGLVNTIRANQIYSRDINQDHSLEVPAAVLLPKQSPDAPDYWLFDWYGYKKDGSSSRILSTYHCIGDGWYLIIPESARESFCVRRDDGAAGERRVVISSLGDEGRITDSLAINTLTGDNRHDKAEIEGRFILREDATTIYAAEFLGEPEQRPGWINKEVLSDSFYLIYNEWNTA